MQMYGGVEIQLHPFLILALDGCEWIASCPSHFTVKEEAPVPTG
jgi:hypothetical protein